MHEPPSGFVLGTTGGGPSYPNRGANACSMYWPVPECSRFTHTLLTYREAKARALDGLEVLLRNNHISVDVLEHVFVRAPQHLVLVPATACRDAVATTRTLQLT